MIMTTNSSCCQQSFDYAFEAEYISIKGHDLQDILFRIGMEQSSARYQNLWVKVNPFVDCDSPEFLAEVWGIEKLAKREPQCLYIAPKVA